MEWYDQHAVELRQIQPGKPNQNAYFKRFNRMGRKMHFTGTTVVKVIDGKIVEEIGLDDAVTALTQLCLIKATAVTGDA